MTDGACGRIRWLYILTKPTATIRAVNFNCFGTPFHILTNENVRVKVYSVTHMRDTNTPECEYFGDENRKSTTVF